MGEDSRGRPWAVGFQSPRGRGARSRTSRRSLVATATRRATPCSTWIPTRPTGGSSSKILSMRLKGSVKRKRRWGLSDLLTLCTNTQLLNLLPSPTITFSSAVTGRVVPRWRFRERMGVARWLLRSAAAFWVYTIA